MFNKEFTFYYGFFIEIHSLTCRKINIINVFIQKKIDRLFKKYKLIKKNREFEQGL